MKSHKHLDITALNLTTSITLDSLTTLSTALLISLFKDGLLLEQLQPPGYFRHVMWLHSAIETGIILYIDQVAAVIFPKKVSDFSASESFFINPLSLYTNLNCCCCFIRDLFSKHISFLQLRDPMNNIIFNFNFDGEMKNL